MKNKVDTIQITENFFGVVINGQRAGHIDRNADDTDWNAHLTTSIGVELLAKRVDSPEKGTRWIAAMTI